MAASTTFLNTCHALIAALPEYTAYRAARLAFEEASEESRLAKWQLLYGDNQAGGSPALRLRRAIRDIVAANAGSTESSLDREDAYRQLAAPFLTRRDDRPLTSAEEAAVIRDLVALGE